MKRCPECRRDYHDDSLAYCLDDGAVLVDGPAEPPTAIFAAASSSSENPTEVLKPNPDRITSRKLAVRPGISVNQKLSILRWTLGLIVLSAFAGAAYVIYQRPSAKSHIASIAVLPFSNEGNDPAMAYLSDGVSESLIDKLSHVSGLKVIARSSSFKFRGPDVDVQDAANRLGAEAVITGSVSKVNDKLVLHVEMIDAKANQQVWSEQFSRAADDVLAVQQDVAGAALGQIKAFISVAVTDVSTKPTTNNEAYDVYLKARFLDQTAQSPGDVEKEIALLQQALALDPNFAEAMGLLGNAYDDYSNHDPAMYLALSEKMLDRAVEINPQLAEARGYRGKLLRNEWRWAEADAEFKKALELNPNLAWVHNSYALLLAEIMRFDDAVVETRRAVELDPLVFGAGADSAFVLMCAHHYDEAITEAKRVLKLNPNDMTALNVLTWSADAQGRSAEALELYRKEMQFYGVDSESRATLAYFLIKAGNKEEARSILEEVNSSRPSPPPYLLASIYASLGDKDKAFEDLELAFQQRYKDMSYLRTDPSVDPLRSDPRFEDLVRRMNFPN